MNGQKGMKEQSLSLAASFAGCSMDLLLVSGKHIRKERSGPVLDAYLLWLRQERSRTLPKSKIEEAIGFSLNQWNKLTSFLEDGRLEIDNNRSERAIKPFVIGQKNWLFANTPRGVKASSII